jgi:transposase-like protein
MPKVNQRKICRILGSDAADLKTGKVVGKKGYICFGCHKLYTTQTEVELCYMADSPSSHPRVAFAATAALRLIAKLRKGK